MEAGLIASYRKGVRGKQKHAFMAIKFAVRGEAGRRRRKSFAFIASRLAALAR